MTIWFLNSGTFKTPSRRNGFLIGRDYLIDQTDQISFPCAVDRLPCAVLKNTANRPQNLLISVDVINWEGGKKLNEPYPCPWRRSFSESIDHMGPRNGKSMALENIIISGMSPARPRIICRFLIERVFETSRGAGS